MLEGKKGISQVSVTHHEEAPEDRDAAGLNILSPVPFSTPQLI